MNEVSAPTLATTTANVSTFSASHPPAMQVSPGEVFVLETADRFKSLYQGEAADPQLAASMVGPVSIRGAKPGHMLEVRVIDIVPATAHGFVLTSPGYGILGEAVATRTKRVKVHAGAVEWDDGKARGWRPMIGKIGLAPAAGARSNKASGQFGGAISSPDVGPGASLFLPVAAAGGLLCMEDVHARMGDGEATASAVEMAAKVRLCCQLHELDGRPLPLVVTPSEAVTHGQGDTLDEAAAAATHAMLALIRGRLGVDTTEAAMLVGSAVDLRISFMGAAPRKVRACIARRIVNL